MPSNKVVFLCWSTNLGRIADTSEGVVDPEIARKGNANFHDRSMHHGVFIFIE